jgi:hypothetical protein
MTLIHTIGGCKMQYPHYNLKFTLSIEKENVITTWQFKHAHYTWVAKCNTCIMTLKSTMLSMGGQNAKPICQTWNILNGIWWPSKEIVLLKLGTKQQ